MRPSEIYKPLFVFVLATLCLAAFQNCGEFQTNTSPVADSQLRLVGLNSKGEVVEEMHQYEIQGDNLVVQGDLIVGDESLLANGQTFAVNDEGEMSQVNEDDDFKTAGNFLGGQKWPRGDLYFAVGNDVNAFILSSVETAVDRLNQAFDANGIGIDIYQMPVDNINESAFVLIGSSTGCSAAAGYRGRQQPLSLASGCGVGGIMHEFLHSLGIMHEQTRFDRDEFITINSENIIAGQEHNFRKSQILSNDIGEYDFASIMHYGAKYFSSNGSPTIEVNEGFEEFASLIENRNLLSDKDISTLKELYPQDNSTNLPGTSPTAMNPPLDLSLPSPSRTQNIRIASQTENSVTVVWNLAPSSEEVFLYDTFLNEVGESLQNGGFLGSQSVGLETSVTFSGLSSNKDYSLRVRAHNKSGRTQTAFAFSLEAARGPASVSPSLGGKYRFDGINTEFQGQSVCQLRSSSTKVDGLVDVPGDSPLAATLRPLYSAMYKLPSEGRYCGTVVKPPVVTTVPGAVIPSPSAGESLEQKFAAIPEGVQYKESANAAVFMKQDGKACNQRSPFGVKLEAGSAKTLEEKWIQDGRVNTCN